MTSVLNRPRLFSQASRTYSGRPSAKRGSPTSPRLPNLLAMTESPRCSLPASATSSSLRPRAHISALVEIELILQGQDVPFGIDRCASMMVRLARMVGGHQMLAPILDPFDRPLQSHGGDTNKKIFGIELASDSEPAAGIAFFQHHGGRAA